MLNDRLQRQMEHARVTPVRSISIEDDQEYRTILVEADVLNGRSLGEFAGNIGLSKAQAQSMSKEQIVAFVRQAEENLANGPTPDFVLQPI
jgi:hypothetical protein